MDANDTKLILLLAAAGPCSLDSSPKKNWVENAGGLPNYICHIAKGIMKSGKSKSQAIAIAVSRCKVWAAGGDDVDADTRAKAAKAVAEWEKLKGKNAAKQVIKASRADGSEFLMLSNTGSFNTEWVRRAWEMSERAARQAYEREHSGARDIGAPASVLYPYRWIRELWSDYIVIEVEGPESGFQKVPYTVKGTEVIFGEPVVVEQTWTERPDEPLTSMEKRLLGDVLINKSGALTKLMTMAVGK